MLQPSAYATGRHQQQGHGRRSRCWVAESVVEADYAEHEDLANRKKRSGRGFTFHYLVAALAIASSNLRAIAAFFKKLFKKAVKKMPRLRHRKDELIRPLSRPSHTRTPASPGSTPAATPIAHRSTTERCSLPESRLFRR